MAVYFITGKLGSGKTLVSIGKIREKLNAGCKVATNIDLNLEKLIDIKSKESVVYRVSDKPTLQDLETIGVGNTSYNEDKNGLLVLDECGTWFNSRSWGDKSRQDVINWFLHARKLGWDIIFLVQDISIVDKQAREALAEHVVYCRRLDRVGIPFLSAFLRLAGIRLTLPKAHLAIVKYGHVQSSMIVERWLYRGRDLYHGYDTKQGFSDNYEHQTYQLLPPYYTHYRYLAKRDARFYMRLTKIYLKRFNRPLLIVAGFVLGAVLTGGFLLSDLVQQKKSLALAEQQAKATIIQKPVVQPKPEVISYLNLTGSKIVSYTKLGISQNYTIMTADRKQLTLTDIKNNGYEVQLMSPCRISVTKGTKNEEITC